MPDHNEKTIVLNSDFQIINQPAETCYIIAKMDLLMKTNLRKQNNGRLIRDAVVRIILKHDIINKKS
ncbi:MAG: hypothetical protein ACOCXH_16540 [Cyclobacteriaceae bacterium]